MGFSQHQNSEGMRQAREGRDASYEGVCSEAEAAELG